ncbi:MAG: PEP/pyruvate-binding domain-containing protein [Anaeromyxobacteraceae bacterium]
MRPIRSGGIERASGSVLRIDGAAALPQTAGGKAMGLAEIAGAGLTVPTAWVVLPGTEEHELDELAAALAAKGIARVAVRSSSADEDGGERSFAGIHETELGVPPERLREAIARVAASPQSERAASYRRQHGLPGATGPCAVVVQELVDAEWAGVAFGKGDGVLVEAVEGLGEVAVNGDATPEQVELLRDGGAFRVTRRWPRRQSFAVRASGSGTERATLDGERPSLPETVALEIAAGVAELEKARGRPLDVEWAVRGGRVAFLQARPQTRPLEAETLPHGETWTRANASDTIPEIASASVRKPLALLLDRLMHDFYARLGAPVASGIPMSAVVAGRFVFNEKTFFHVGDLLGVPRSWAQVLSGGAGEGSNAYRAPDPWKVLRHLDVLLRMLRFSAGAEKKARRHVGELRAHQHARATLPAAGRSDAELLDEVTREDVEVMQDALLMVMRVASGFQQVAAMGATALKANLAPAALLARLIDPSSVSVSTRQMEEQVELARAMRGWEGGREFLQEIGPNHADRTWWARALPPSLWERLERWLAAYGHRCAGESDWAPPRVADDLRLLAVALRPLVLAPTDPEPLEARRARRRADSAAAWAEISSELGALTRWRLRSPVQRLGKLMLVREELRSAMALQRHRMRLALLELGRRLNDRGRLDAVDEVFHLTLEELERAVRDPAFDARGAVARERARIAAWRRIEVPNRFTSEEVPGLGRLGAAAAGGATLLRGTAVSPGMAEGRACVLRSADDGAKLALGGILVAHSTDPGWTPLFARAVGVVVELGGVMSHSATVAREYGLPSVSNVDGAIAKLRDGDLLRVDGTHGTVEILERG